MWGYGLLFLLQNLRKGYDTATSIFLLYIESMNKKISLFISLFAITLWAQGPTTLGTLWLRGGAGVEFYGNDESNPVTEVSLNVPLVDQIDFRADFDLLFGDDVQFEAFPGAVFNMATLLKNPGGINPYARAGILVESDDGKGDLGWHAGIGAGAEIPIGPAVTIDPHFTAFIIETSRVMIGIDGGYWISPKIQLLVDFDWNGDEEYRAGGDVGYRF